MIERKQVDHLHSDCIFCEIHNGNIKSDIVHSDHQCFVIKDMSPQSPIHLLIISTAHIAHLESPGDKLLANVGHMVAVATEMASTFGIDRSGYRMVINQGKDANQTIEHLHIHLLGGHQLGPAA